MTGSAPAPWPTAPWLAVLLRAEIEVRARSTWVNFAANAPAPVDDVGVYLVADFDDVLTWCADDRWRISERRISPVFRDPSRAPVTG